MPIADIELITLEQKLQALSNDCDDCGDFVQNLKEPDSAAK